MTNVVRPLWRSNLAAWFPQLPAETQAWYANAPTILATVTSQWGTLNPWQRGSMVQQWAMELPSMLWMLEPVLAQAHQEEMQEHVRGQIAAWRQQAAQFANFNTNMTNLTINMIRSK